MKIPFSFEMPWAYMENHQRLCDYDYALVHLFETEPEYFKFMVDALKAGRKVILDNSAYELHGKPFDSDAFAGWIEVLQHNTSKEILEDQLTYVLPDVFDDYMGTLNLVKRFVNQYSLPGKVMAVCQGNTIDELTTCFKEYLRDDRIDTIGVNFMSAAYTDLFKNMYTDKGDVWKTRMKGRQSFISYLYILGYLKKPVHLLGCALPSEFRYYTETFPIFSSYIKSADTSAPITAALEGSSLEGVIGGITQKSPLRINEHFGDEYNPNIDDMIQRNIWAFREYNLV